MFPNSNLYRLSYSYRLLGMSILIMLNQSFRRGLINLIEQR